MSNWIRGGASLSQLWPVCRFGGLRQSCLACVWLFLAAGCHSGSSTQKVDPNAFAQAAPELKQFWASAQAADHTNNYADGLTLYFTLMRENLTPEERQAVNTASTELNARYVKALQAGDPGAKAALAQMQTNPPNRMR